MTKKSPSKAVDAEAPVVDLTDPHEGLVAVRKGEETIHVHPTTLPAHLKAGWKHA